MIPGFFLLQKTAFRHTPLMYRQLCLHTAAFQAPRRSRGAWMLYAGKRAPRLRRRIFGGQCTSKRLCLWMHEKKGTRSMTHEEYMHLACSLALRGMGRVSPNPLVGAVIVKDGRIIGEGWHAKYGDLHAERNALKNCRERGEDPAGADIYVTLEPCCHHGKQPPCTDALIEAGIARVFMGSGDPNPRVAGKGVQILRDHGIEVIGHVLESECLALNDVFFHYIRTGLPYVVLKYAMTLDGKIACHTGASRWVTGEEARAHVHKTRNWLTGIMVGVNTVIADDPLLTCRTEGGRDPVRIICDSRLRTPQDSRIVKTAREVPTILAACETDPARQKPYLDAGCRIVTVPEKRGFTNLNILMQKLGSEEKIDSILLEGGASLAWSALESGIVSRVQAYIAPKLFGGADAKTPVGGIGFDTPDLALKLKNLRLTRLGEDLLIEGDLPPAGCTPAESGPPAGSAPSEDISPAEGGT